MTRVGVSAVVVVHHHRLLGRCVDPIGDGNFSRFSLGERIKYVVVMLTNQAREVEKLPLPLSVFTRRALSLSLALCTKLVPCFNVVSEWLKFMTNIFRLNFGGIFERASLKYKRLHYILAPFFLSPYPMPSEHSLNIHARPEFVYVFQLLLSS